MLLVTGFWIYLGWTCFGLFCLLILLVAFTIASAYVQFRQAPEQAWARHVSSLAASAESRLRAEEDRIRQSGRADERADRAILDAGFRNYLKTIPTGELERFPGIGPVTISRLEEAGYGNLAALQEAPADVTSLGPKRVSDIMSAVRERTRSAREVFDQGRCREAGEMRHHLDAARAARTKEGARAVARQAALSRFLKDLEPLRRMAAGFDAASYLLRQQQGRPAPSLPALPDLDKVFRDADREDLFAAHPTVSSTENAPAAPSGDLLSEPRPDPKPSTPAPATPQRDDDLFAGEMKKAPVSPDDQGGKWRWSVCFAFAIARSDGKLSKKERALIDEHFARVAPGSARIASWCNEFESGTLDLETCLQQLARLPEPDRRDLLDLANRLVDASGRSSRKDELLQRVAWEWQLAPLAASRSPAAPATSSSSPSLEPGDAKPQAADPRVALEIDAHVPLTPELVRRQYNLLMERYAPDKFDHLGNDFRIMAQTKRDAVQSAATQVLSVMGEPLQPPKSDGPSELRRNPDLDAVFGDL